MRQILSASIAILCLSSIASADDGMTFYVDASTGSDSNPGTQAAPLASYLPFVSAYGQSDSNIGRIELQPSDEVVFLAGVYDETFQLPGSNVNHGFRLRNVHGTETAPITLRAKDGVVLRADAADGSEVTKLELFDVSHFVVEGFEVTGLGTGIQIFNSHDVLVKENWIHDIDGQASSIIAGLAISASTDVEATGNLIHDNYDRSTPAFNSYNVEFDENTGYVEFHNNYVFNSADNIRTGTGPGVKHDGEGLLEIHHNVIRNAPNAGIALDTRLASVHHNLVLNSEALWLVPNESIIANEELHDIRVFNNTIVDQATGDRVGGGLNFSARVQDSEGSIRFNDNIIVDLDQQGQGQGILNISPYGSNEEYDFWVESGRFEADGNVYFNPNHTPVFDVYSAQSRGDLGAQYSFEQWQQLGFDPNGAVADPQFNQLFEPLNRLARNAGWYAGEQSRLTLFATDQTDSVVIAPQVSEGQSQAFTLRRSGDDFGALSQTLTVSLQSSAPDQIELPATLTFLAGQSELQFEAVIQPDSALEGERAERISAEAAGTVFNVDAWLRISDSAGNPVGDFDGDGEVDCDDLDGYVGNLGLTVNTALAPLDLDNDGIISATDVNTHVTTLVQTSNGQVGTFHGDLNCDGVVNVLGDAFALVSNLNRAATSYSQGDINFDGTVNVLGDAFILIGRLGQSNEP